VRRHIRRRHQAAERSPVCGEPNGSQSRQTASYPGRRSAIIDAGQWPVEQSSATLSDLSSSSSTIVPGSSPARRAIYGQFRRHLAVDFGLAENNFAANLVPLVRRKMSFPRCRRPRVSGDGVLPGGQEIVLFGGETASQACVVSEVTGKCGSAIEVPGTAALNEGGAAATISVCRAHRPGTATPAGTTRQAEACSRHS
jgi:hypothetical protein